MTRTPGIVLAIVPALMLLAAANGRGAPGPKPPVPEIHAALIVSIDGLRPDLALRAGGRELRSLMERGTFTLWAATTPSSVTLPSHTSMLTGVSVSKHRVDWNQDLPFQSPVYPARPTLFELARRAGYTTAMAAGKSKFSALAKPGTLDWTFVPDGTVSDSTVTDTAVRWILEKHPGVLFVHLAGVDIAGHAAGWGSTTQLAAIATADRCVGRMLGALRRAGRIGGTVVLITSDHGGAGREHGPDDPRSREIPWIVAGPGIRKNFDLTLVPGRNVRTEDTFATLCWLLGIELPGDIEGRPVTEILEEHPTTAGLDRNAPGGAR